MKNAQLKQNKIASGNTLIRLLNEFLDTEALFIQKVRGMRILFQNFCGQNRPAKILQEYHHHLKNSLDSFETIYSESLEVFQNGWTFPEEQVMRLAKVYCDEGFYRHLSLLIGLYPAFISWEEDEGDEEYAHFIRESRFFPFDVIEEAACRFHPMIFSQHLQELVFFFESFRRFCKNREIELALAIMAKTKDETTRKLNFRSVVETICDLLDEKGEEKCRFAIELYLNERLFCDPKMHELEKKVKQLFPLHCRAIFFELFESIERLKSRSRDEKIPLRKEFLCHLQKRFTDGLEYMKREHPSLAADCSILEEMGRRLLFDEMLSPPPFADASAAPIDTHRLLWMKSLAEYRRFVEQKKIQKTMN